MSEYMFYLMYHTNGNSVSLQNRKNVVKKKITIKDGFDIKSVLEASDEVLVRRKKIWKCYVH